MEEASDVDSNNTRYVDNDGYLILNNFVEGIKGANSDDNTLFNLESVILACTKLLLLVMILYLLFSSI